jgi:hypothetical protein
MNLDQVGDQVRTSRRDQGLADHVTAERFLDQLAAEILDQAGPLQVDGDGEPVRLIADPSTPDGRPGPVRHERVRMNDEEDAIGA